MEQIRTLELCSVSVVVTCIRRLTQPKKVIQEETNIEHCTNILTLLLCTANVVHRSGANLSNDSSLRWPCQEVSISVASAVLNREKEVSYNGS